MIKLTLAEIVEAIGGRPWDRLPTISAGGVSTDSRSIAASDLFFALTGDRFDGHDFVADALRRGAVGAVVDVVHHEHVDQQLRAANLGLPHAGMIIEVPDTLAALGQLAAYHRQQMAAEVIAVVGSNGKTTTKAMIHHILSGRLRGRCSPKSYNNAIGVPLTLLSAEQGDEYLVVEIGTNSPGEVATLGEIVQPDVAVLTCIGEEHLERLGDLDGVAAEECSIFGKLRGKGFAAVNSDDDLVEHHLPREGLVIARFGSNVKADVRFTAPTYEMPWLRFMLNERFPFRLRMIGEHNAQNAAAAATIARRFGVDFDEAAVRLESFVPPPMRNEVVEIGGVTLINDAYNANPQSALAAIDVLEQMPCSGKRVAVFGEMRELGTATADMHAKVAGRLRSSGVQRVMLVGAASALMHDALAGDGLFGPSVEQCESLNVCVERLCEGLQAGDVVLLKASRAVELDRLIEPLRARLTSTSIA